MSEQQSQKSGVRSEAQKTMRAREGYDPIPPSNPVGGAFGDPSPDSSSDQDLALKLSARNPHDKNEDAKQDEEE